MEYGKLIAVTGMPGLFELVSSKSDGAIVRSLDDNSTKFASTRQHQFSHLESIEVYTVRDNVNLTDIFKAMESAGGKLPDEKDAKAIKAYFEKVYPDLDFERVYSSDMKKMVKWYGIISAKGIEIKLTEVAEEEEAPVEEAVAAEEVKTAKKATKKAEPKAEEAVAEEAPKKKAAKKKKED
jgi:antitoxin component of RelBE/YafQ-DinJ toxin-antitoxin module